jgi:uncharacterized protein HemX
MHPVIFYLRTMIRSRLYPLMIMALALYDNRSETYLQALWRFQDAQLAMLL